MDEILALEADVELLHSMCLNAVEQVVLMERYADFALPEWSWQPIAESWRRSDPHVYGRFDLRYDGRRPAVLLEYNADTPTTLLEAAILQWYWLQDKSSRRRPVELAARAAGRPLESGSGSVAQQRIHFTWTGVEPTGEDQITTTYMQETAAEAGFNTVGLTIEDVGWDSALERFVDLEEAQIDTIFKLLPVGVGARGRVRQERGVEPSTDDVDRTAVENVAVQQGNSGRAVGDVSRSPQPAARLPGRPARAHRICPQAQARPRGRQHHHRRRRHGHRDGWRLRGGRVTSTNCWTRCRNSTTCGPRWARGSWGIRRLVSASARPADW